MPILLKTVNHQEHQRLANDLIDNNRRFRKYFLHSFIPEQQWKAFIGNKGKGWYYTVPASDTYESASWEWDLVHGILKDEVDPRGGLAEVISNQNKDGFIPHMNFKGGDDEKFWGKPRHSFITQPPIYGLLYDKFKSDEEALEILYMAVMKNIDWWDQKRLKNDLPFTVHPWETGRDAGRDNDVLNLKYMLGEEPKSMKLQTINTGKKDYYAKKARFAIHDQLKEKGTNLSGAESDRFVLQSPDMASHLVFTIEETIKYARKKNRFNDVEKLEAIKQRVVKAAREQMWDDQTGFFYSVGGKRPSRELLDEVKKELKKKDLEINESLYSVGDDGKILTKTIAGLMTLYSGIPDHDMAKALLSALKSSDFNTTWPVPTVAKSDPGFVDDDYWRGSTWINTNYFIILGLERYAKEFREIGDVKTAKEFAEKGIQLIQKTQELTYNHGFFEFYSSTGEGVMGNGPKDFTWSTLSVLLTKNLEELKRFL
ncbi:MAG: MGH1-like glycoside hydrolase domain-containing protein [Bacteriovoracaceae bacterium]